MKGYLVKRILQALGVILCISAITFFVLNNEVVVCRSVLILIALGEKI